MMVDLIVENGRIHTGDPEASQWRTFTPSRCSQPQREASSPTARAGFDSLMPHQTGRMPRTTRRTVRPRELQPAFR